MKVLIVCSGNAPDFKFEIHQAFIYDQVVAISKCSPEITFDYFIIKGNGVLGYLNNLKRLYHVIKANNYDIVHAHFALSGLFSNFQRIVPVVCTFHGSDINLLKNRFISSVVALLSRSNLYVSKQLRDKSFVKKNSVIIPCGVDLSLFNPLSKEQARASMNLAQHKKYILFASSFANKIKNYKLLEESHKHLSYGSSEILELKNLSRFEVATLMSAVDVCVMTSFSEGSPQFIKEAMACNCPIVTTNVGDVSDVIGDTEGCYITTYEVTELANKIDLAFNFAERKVKTQGRSRIVNLGLDSECIAKQIVAVYEKVLSRYN